MINKYTINYILFILLFLLNSTVSFGEDVGSIEGQVKSPWVRRYPAVIYIDEIKGRSFDPPKEVPVMDQLDLTFIPFVLPIMAGTSVEFKNSDTVNHSIFSPSDIADKFDLGKWSSKNEKRIKTFTKPGVAVILCNIHSEMEAWLIVTKTPFFAITDNKGNFSIKDVPVGMHKLKLWHKKLPPKEKEVAIKKDAVTKIIFTK